MSGRLPRVVGVCGLIGSGKSVVMQCFEAWGYPIFDCDKVAKSVYFEANVRRALREALGIDPIDDSGQIDKPSIMRVISESVESRVELEGIVHAAVMQCFKQWVSGVDGSVVLMESAILFSSGFSEMCDTTIAVDAPESLRCQRVLSRDGGDPERFERINRLQALEASLMSGADHHINNDDRYSVVKQIESLIPLLG